MQSMISYFQLKVALVYDNCLTADAIISKLKPVPNIGRISNDVHHIWCYLLLFLHKATEEDKFIVFYNFNVSMTYLCRSQGFCFLCYWLTMPY